MVSPAGLKPTLAEFKRFAREIAPTVTLLLQAKVIAQMERERVDAYIGPIFARYAFEYGPLGQKCGLTGIIPTEKDLYLADLCSEKMDQYYAECDAAHRAHGFTGKTGHCPALLAEHNVIKAERALIDVAGPFFGLSNDKLTMMDDRKKFLDLVIGAAVKTGRVKA